MLAEHDADPVSGGLSYLEMAAIARFLAGKFRRGETDSFREFFSAVERCLLEGNDEAVTLVMVGLLEDLQNSNVTDIEDYTVWAPYQGPTTLRAWNAVEAFWNGEVNALSSFEPRP